MATKKTTKKVTKKTSKKKGTILITSITKAEATALYQAFGFKSAVNWSAGKMQKKLQNLDKMIEGIELTPDMQKHVNTILRSQAAGKPIEVIDKANATADKKAQKEVDDASKREDDRKAEKRSNDKTKEKKAAKKTIKKAKRIETDKKAVEASTKKKTEGKNIDAVGNRVGSIKAQIWGALTKKPKTMEKLQEEAGVKNPQTGYLNEFIKRGLAVKSDKGYALSN